MHRAFWLAYVVNICGCTRYMEFCTVMRNGFADGPHVSAFCNKALATVLRYSALARMSLSGV